MKRNRLSSSLENKVAHLIQRYKEEEGPHWDIDRIYQYVQRVDMSLRRMKKGQLQQAIENVLEKSSDLMQENEASGASDDEGEYAVPAENSNAMNKSVTSLWQRHRAPDSPTSTKSPGAEASPASEAATPIEENQDPKIKKRTKVVAGVISKRSKSDAREQPVVPTEKLSDLGGIENCVEEIMELIAMPLAHPEVYIHTGVQPPRGVLLHGPPGCGKTKLAHAIAGELEIPLINISAPSIVSGMSGESEKKIRDVFEDARKNAPCLLFIDEIDAITPKRETAQREMERRIVAQLLTCMDDLSWEKTDNKPVMIIGATNRPDALDAALRRAGRFDREISMGVPDDKSREKILQVLASKLRMEGNVDFAAIAKATPGYVGADLQALITTAGVIAVKRIFKQLRDSAYTQANEGEEKDAAMDIDHGQSEGREVTVSSLPTTTVEEFESQSALDQLRSVAAFIKSHKEPLTETQLESLAITSDDFYRAIKKVQPSSKREGFATVPDVSWDNIGALQYVRDELRMAVVEPINHPDYFQRVGITSPAGVLLWGPPGCGKTLLAKAVANESNTNFISVKGPELLNKYVGESERGVRQVFARARASSPCVIFFDELDALCSRRDDQQTDASARVVNTLLTELDGVENRSQVYVIAATNRPDMIDPAMLRPGRLDKLLYVELPTPSERLDILTKLTKNTPLAADVLLVTVANDARCEGFSGADLASLVREAAVASLRSQLYMSGANTLDPSLALDSLYVSASHFDVAFTKVSPSVLPHDKRQYEMLRKQFG